MCASASAVLPGLVVAAGGCGWPSACWRRTSPWTAATGGVHRPRSARSPLNLVWRTSPFRLGQRPQGFLNLPLYPDMRFCRAAGRPTSPADREFSSSPFIVCRWSCVRATRLRALRCGPSPRQTNAILPAEGDRSGSHSHGCVCTGSGASLGRRRSPGSDTIPRSLTGSDFALGIRGGGLGRRSARCRARWVVGALSIGIAEELALLVVLGTYSSDVLGFSRLGGGFYA